MDGIFFFFPKGQAIIKDMDDIDNSLIRYTNYKQISTQLWNVAKDKDSQLLNVLKAGTYFCLFHYFTS